ncbi:MAG: hypothetical protein ACR2NZ_13195, partial [Rubripirellula sp.]
PNTGQPNTGQPNTGQPNMAYTTPMSGGAVDPASSSEPNANPFSSPLESGMAATPGMNPYRPSYNPTPVAAVGELRIVPRSVEEVVSVTISIFGARWGTLLVAFLLVMLVTFAVFVIPFLVLAAIADAGGEQIFAIGMLLGLPLIFFFSAYISVGLARNAIAVARNSPSPLMELFPPLGVVVRFIVGGVFMFLAAATVFGIFAGLAAALASLSGNQGVAALVVGIGMIIGVAASMVAYWLLWSWMFVVSDGQTSALGSIRAAYQISMANKLTSVLLLVIAMVLSTVGTSLCYVGLLITQPLTNLMFATAYLLMTNQPLDDPRMVQAPTPGPQPGQPEPQQGQPSANAGQGSSSPTQQAGMPTQQAGMPTQQAGTPVGQPGTQPGPPSGPSDPGSPSA